MSDIKYICFYLPQFHEVEENNKWWGKGFTEWTNVKNAKPLFKEHYQPREPYENNYYDLSNINDLKEQFKLANDSNIYGFCFYHYWFKGKQLLEKPAELLLSDKGIAGKFCFSWANETWARTWNGRSKDVLMLQEYGSKEDWIIHINYLINFFKDDRYIKIDNKPVLLIYNIPKIENFNEMLKVWNNELKKNDINGLCIIDTLNSYNHKKNDNADYAVLFEPWYTITTDYKLRVFLRIQKAVRSFFLNFISYLKIPKILQATINYDYINKQIVDREINDNVFPGLFPDWDNSPRKAKTGHSTVFTSSTPNKFKYYNEQLRKKVNTQSEENKFIFINAWNEWAESAYLEKDKKYGVDYLNVIKECKK
jgi:lipopolysaccharide biosynthesis protein